MRCAVDPPLQRHVMREILVTVTRRWPVGSDLARVLAQTLRGLQARCTTGRPVLPGVMVALQGGDTVAIPSGKSP